MQYNSSGRCDQLIGPYSHVVTNTWTWNFPSRGQACYLLSPKIWIPQNLPHQIRSEDHHRETKHIKENHHWLHPTTTTNCYSVLQDEEPEQPTWHKEHGKTAKTPPTYVSDFTTISPLIRLLEQTVTNQYELKAHSNNLKPQKPIVQLSKS